MDFAKHDMYYVAIVCPPAVNEKVLKLKYWMKDQFGCIIALRSPAHITLIPPFWLEESRATELQLALASFSASVDELELKLENFSHFNKKVLFVNVQCDEPLVELKKQTQNHFAKLPGQAIEMDDRSFQPHVTIASRDLKPGDFEKAWNYLSKKDFSANFRTNDIALLRLSAGKWIIIGYKNWLIRS